MNWLEEKARNRQIWQDFLAEYKAVLNDLTGIEPDQLMHVERALRQLLQRYHTELPPLQSEHLHPDFRKTDVCDEDAPEGAGGCIDMAFWNLLYCCKFFWQTREKFLKQRDLWEGS